MWIAIGIIGGLLTAILVMHFIAPKTTHVERTVDIRVVPETAYEYLSHLSNFNSWSPFSLRDQNMDHGVRGTDGEVGAVYWWKGNKQVGEGEIENKKLDSPGRIDQELRFIKPFAATSDAYYTIKETAAGCQVAWGFRGENKFPMTVIGLLMNMEKALGKDFSQGLERLKTQLEAS